MVAIAASLESDDPKVSPALLKKYFADPEFRKRLYAQGYDDVKTQNEIAIAEWVFYDSDRIEYLREKLVEFGYAKRDVDDLLNSKSSAPDISHYMWICSKSDIALWTLLKAANFADKSKAGLEQLITQTGAALKAQEVERKFGILELMK